MIYGYARVSTEAQYLTIFRRTGCSALFTP
jgi:hypothetical protein